MEKAQNAKQRWAARHTQITITVCPELADEFKARCLAEGISVTGKLKGYMGDALATKAPAGQYETRQKRRRALVSLIRECEAIMEAERRYVDRMPENLEGSPMHEAAESTVDALEEALELLKSAF